MSMTAITLASDSSDALKDPKDISDPSKLSPRARQRNRKLFGYAIIFQQFDRRELFLLRDQFFGSHENRCQNGHKEQYALVDHFPVLSAI